MSIKEPLIWECQPQAEQFILEIVKEASRLNPTIAQLEHDLLHRTSTRLFDWVDHVVVPKSDQTRRRIEESGFILTEGKDLPVFIHPGAQLPRIVLHSFPQVKLGVALAVDSIADFLMTQGEHFKIEGAYFGAFRRCQVSLQQEAALWVIERRGISEIRPSQEGIEQIYTYLQALEKWQTRPRAMEDEDVAMQATIDLAHQLIREVGQHRAAWTVLEGERRYWQSRNTAAQIQKGRQDRLGMGWANHDHHTFRSSRRRFHLLVHLFELLGFHCREQFYAGREAGWGAQVMENPVCRLVLFLDVDLTPDEIAQDIAHEPLPELHQLGTVGLWCALHGDSILKAGMHHLEAQFMFDHLTEDLAAQGVQMMSPFSSFSYLKQAFTVGENWPVEPQRIYRLVEQGQLTLQQGKHFIQQGAIGSHLENLQRREGYKGFNKNNVSVIMKKTDPRLY
jgi:hypothetical protein